MTVKIYHNPRCSKSRETLDTIRAAGFEPVVIEYLKTPPGKEEIGALLDRLGIAPSEAIRQKEALYSNLGLADANDEKLIAAMAENPVLIERPIVVSDKGARICRPPEIVREIL